MQLDRNRALLDRFRQGSREAMETVFRTYSEPLARYLQAGFSFGSAGQPMRFGGVRDRFDLHDLIGETFRRAFEARARLAYDGIAPYEAYLKRIARNLVIDRLRAERWLQVDSRAAEAAADGQAEAEAKAPPSPARSYDQAELRRLLASFTEGLGQDQRRLLALRYEQGLSQEDAAGRLRRTRRWVRTHEARLRKALLKHLGQTGYLPRGANERERRR